MAKTQTSEKIRRTPRKAGLLLRSLDLPNPTHLEARMREDVDGLITSIEATGATTGTALGMAAQGVPEQDWHRFLVPRAQFWLFLSSYRVQEGRKGWEENCMGEAIQDLLQAHPAFANAVLASMDMGGHILLGSLDVHSGMLEHLPKNMIVELSVDLDGCSRLGRLPEGLMVGTFLSMRKTSWDGRLPAFNLPRMGINDERIHTDVGGFTLDGWPRGNCGSPVGRL